MGHSIQRVYTDRKAPNVLFMPNVFQETMQLLTDAHEYFQLFGEDDQLHLSPEMRPFYSQEMSRITLRLSSIMAWIVVQRGIFSGHITSEIAATQGRLEFQEACLIDNRVLNGILPSYVCYLSERTLELYERVVRLDGQIADAPILH